MKHIFITEQQFKDVISKMMSESVYVSGIKGNKASLTYQKGKDYSPGNLSMGDKLKTDLMDKSNHDTYEVKLKGGITSYNITSIKGMEVMHYFKNYFKNEKTNIELTNKRGKKKSYELTMQEKEFNDFLQQFLHKVGVVIEYYMNNLKMSGNNVDFSGISVYPVKSSSNFNTEMAKRIAGLNIMGLPIQAIDENLFLKDLRNLEKDDDFIKKNEKYYNSPLSPSDAKNKPIMDYLDADIMRYQAISKIPVEKYINRISELSEEMVGQLYSYRASHKKGVQDSERKIKSMAEKYKEFYDLYKQCSSIKYYNPATKKQSTVDIDTIAEAKKYTKNQQVEIRTDDVWNLISPILNGQVSRFTGKKYEKLPLKSWKYVGFQIKKLSNPERMGMRNIYNRNTDEELVQKEMEKIKGTVFVIFDDNVSGGATLSDVCYQAKKEGIDYIIPITFGKMSEKWQLGIIPINKPENGFDLS